MLAGSRISHHIRECNSYHHAYLHHQHNQHQLGLRFGFGLVFCPSTSVRPSYLLANSSSSSHPHYSSVRKTGLTFIGRIQPKSSRSETTVISNCFSQCEDDQVSPPERLSPVAGGIVALGKFDALHIGHRELLIQAAKVGAPFLLSLAGMAEVLGWESRAPIVAKCDRKRVLSEWTPLCGGKTPVEFEVQFSKVRHLTPRQFVEKLAKELGVRGVVAGENYRFGYKASGDTSELLRLCDDYGLESYIINSVMDKNQDPKTITSNSSSSKERGQVSSTRIRHALAKGDMKYVSELLGRDHRLLLLTVKHENLWVYNEHRLSIPKSCSLNLMPKEGVYDRCSLLVGETVVMPCRVVVKTTDILLEFEKVVDNCFLDGLYDFECVGVEFKSGS
ncbi:FAD synthetase 2, chloroplastic-like [Impatiens glandulifera]|uniref:FAD synthetase 2, chloroplastic-like n=1 Tax=Impatiens glandulifera TaxID=253017 RepID=UPI001FB0FE7F|nr:FAD synthetase 2, chloroplastic-like [Impatiens glandulifera]